MTQRIRYGNAVKEGGGPQRRGWFVGHFLGPQAGLANSSAVEIKWGAHPAGEEKTTTAANHTATTISILVSGAFRVIFPEDGQEINLSTPGDYALWAPGVAHTWRALQDTVMITVRWPSMPDDQQPVEEEKRG